MQPQSAAVSNVSAAQVTECVECECVGLVQGFHALGNLPAAPLVHKKLDKLGDFVTAWTDELKNMYNKENKRLQHFENNMGKYNQCGFLNLRISLVLSVFSL